MSPIICRWLHNEHSIVVDLCVYRVIQVDGKTNVHYAGANTTIENASRAYIDAVKRMVFEIIEDATK